MIKLDKEQELTPQAAREIEARKEEHAAAVIGEVSGVFDKLRTTVIDNNWAYKARLALGASN